MTIGILLRLASKFGKLLGIFATVFMWEYSYQHINISGDGSVHCTMYTLGGNCDNENAGSCECFTRLLAFFGMPFASFINDIVMNQLNYDQL